MLVVECPNQYTTVDPHMPYSVFMAGGITGCPDWQKELIALLEPVPGTLLNPRQTNPPISGFKSSYTQVQWVIEHMHRAGAILFWFPCEHLCPVSLIELGSWLREPKPLYVGMHLDYTRRSDVETMIKATRPYQKIVYSLRDLAIDVAGSGCLQLGGEKCLHGLN